MNKRLLHEANLKWEEFVKTLSEKESEALADMMEPVSSNKLHYLVATNDAIRFDQAINRLSKIYLYDEEIIPTVYSFYVGRNLHDLAFNYIKEAERYIKSAGKTVSSTIQSILDNSESVHLLQGLKLSLSNIRDLRPKDIPHVTPDIVNDKRNLSEFVLCEIVHATKVLIDKIHGIKKIPHEDRFNDLLLAILRLRIHIWSWSIHDQSRIGKSPTDRDAGKVDFTINAGNPFALLEALVLKNANKGIIQTHIKKMFRYSNYLDRYYIIIYYKGIDQSIDKYWLSYKQIVRDCEFTSDFAFNASADFEDLAPKFDDVNHLKIAKSIHGKSVEVFHLMINLSETPIKSKTSKVKINATRKGTR